MPATAPLDPPLGAPEVPLADAPDEAELVLEPFDCRAGAGADAPGVGSDGTVTVGSFGTFT